MKSRDLLSVIALLISLGVLGAVYVSKGGDGNAPVDETAAMADKKNPEAATSAETLDGKTATKVAKTKKAGRLAAFVVHKTPEEVDPISFVDESGAERTLADWQGKVVLVNFWATWCAPCRHEMPTLDNLNAQLGGPDFEVIALSLDRGGLDKPKTFYSEIGIKSLKLYGDKSGKSGRTFRAVGMPTTVLIGRNGKEIGRIAGPAEWDSEDALALIRDAMSQSG